MLPAWIAYQYDNAVSTLGLWCDAKLQETTTGKRPRQKYTLSQLLADKFVGTVVDAAVEESPEYTGGDPTQGQPVRKATAPAAAEQQRRRAQGKQYRPVGDLIGKKI